MNARTSSTGFWLALASACGFSMKAIFIKLAYRWPIDAVSLLCLRMMFSMPFFVVVGLRESRRSGSLPLTLRQWLSLLSLGLLGYYGSSLFDIVGLRYISAGLERLILFSYPTLTLIFSAIFFGQRIGRREVVALLLCYLGIAAAFANDLHQAAETRSVLIGGGFILCSSLCYAAYLVGSGRLIPVIGAQRFTALAMLISTGASLLHFALSEPLSALNQAWQVYALMLGMALFSTVLPVFALSAAIRRIGAGSTAMIATIGPVLTIGLSAWLLGEPLTIWQGVGTALVVAGVVMSRRK